MSGRPHRPVFPNPLLPGEWPGGGRLWAIRWGSAIGQTSLSPAETCGVQRADPAAYRPRALYTCVGPRGQVALRKTSDTETRVLTAAEVLEQDFRWRSLRRLLTPSSSHLHCFQQVCSLSGSGRTVIRRITVDLKGQFYDPLLTRLN